MRLVVDASVSVKWLVPEEGSGAALALTTGEHELHAPRLMAAELANALWSKARRGQMEHSKASALMASVSGMPVQTRHYIKALSSLRWQESSRS